MSNPDATGSSADALVTAFPVAILFLLIVIFMFQIKNSIPHFTLILWIGLPLLAFGIAAAANFISQYVYCKITNAGKAFLGAVPSSISTIIALFLSYFSFCRIPIATVFAPLFVGQSVNITKNSSNNAKTININTLKNSNSKACCAPILTLEGIESKYPIIEGFSYGFYVMFGMLFGMTFGNGIATIC
jgi:hypothetical protein